MSDSSIWAMVGTASLTGVLHTLIPDHWLPFVLMGRAQNWSAPRVARVSGLAALLHTGLSTLLGLAALGLGLGAARLTGERMEHAGAVLLIVFGLVYALWSWRKGGHFHPGGARVHAHETTAPCDGEEGDANPAHLHYHADQALIAGRPQQGGVWLALIVGLNPCVLFLPIVLAAAPQGAAATGLIVLAYALPTALLMVGLSVLGVALGWKLRLPGVARHAELISGLLIAALGVVIWAAHAH